MADTAAEANNLLYRASATGEGRSIDRGFYMWSAYGTFDGAAVSCEVSPDDGVTWIPYEGLTLTEDGGVSDYPFPNVMVRTAIANAGANTIISSSIHFVRKAS